MQQIYEFIANKQAIQSSNVCFFVLSAPFAPTFCSKVAMSGLRSIRKTYRSSRHVKEVEKQTKLSLVTTSRSLKNKTLHQFGVRKSHAGEFSQRNP